jgi:TonB family protein
LDAKKEANQDARRIMSAKAKTAAGISVMNGKVIKGKVIADGDKEPIPGATVTVLGTDISVLTDENGEFSITLPSNQNMLALSSIGYENQILKLKNTDTSAKVLLKPATQALAEVVITKPTTADSDAKPPMDEGEYRVYINRHIDYPKAYTEMGKEGSVGLEFTVDKDGSLSKFKVFHSMGPEFDKPSIRVMKNGPKWAPAYKNGKPVVTKVRYYVNFIHL